MQSYACFFIFSVLFGSPVITKQNYFPYPVPRLPDQLTDDTDLSRQVYLPASIVLSTCFRFRARNGVLWFMLHQICRT
ncbi:hypothetical protein GE09DRAFT_1150701 [Coniochaeta sp. 2T2.1]|nr:hypothetical protein GE09DRAFT_1150701 [Coniochaeta sp. 2T2.1]